MSHPPEISQEAARDLLASCKELREVCAAAMRVLVKVGLENGAASFEIELKMAKIKNGFGVRAQDAIGKAEGKESTE